MEKKRVFELGAEAGYTPFDVEHDMETIAEQLSRPGVSIPRVRAGWCGFALRMDPADRRYYTALVDYVTGSSPFQVKRDPYV